MSLVQKQQYLPTHYTGCQLWMDGADSSSMTLSGSTLTAWRDKSGKGNTATANGAPQFTSAGIVTTITTSPGDNFYMEPMNNPASGSTLSISVVATLNSYSGGLNWQYARIVSFWDGTGADFSTHSFIICQEANTQAIRVYHNGGALFSPYPITYGVPFITTVIWNGANCAWYVNGSLAGYTSSSNTFSFSKLGLGVNIGSKSWPNDCLNGVISEVIMYYYAIPLIQLKQLETYLIQKWGLTGYLVPNVWQRPLYVGIIRGIANGSLTSFGKITSSLSYSRVGLVFYLDAGNSSSYSGSGSTWNDLAGSGLTTTLYNSPTYSSANGGYLSFSPSSSQYAQTSGALSSLSNWSLEVWHYFTNTNTDNANRCIITQVYEGSSINFNLGNTSTSQYGFTVGYFSGNWYSTRNDYALPSVGWYHIVGTYDGTNIKLYVNNLLIDTSASATASSSGGTPIRFMRRWDNAEYWGGALAVVRIYNRALLPNEIEGNYFWGRGRFGL
jgi:hypothetical protein